MCNMISHTEYQPPLHLPRCFGFDTAVQEAQRALDAARVEASSAFRGVGIVKLMGRQSGFIAVQASLASGAACLIRRSHSLAIDTFDTFDTKVRLCTNIHATTTPVPVNAGQRWSTPPSGAVDVCLIPEVTFKLEKLYQYVEQVLDRQGYAVVCVAEGAGQVGVQGSVV